MSIQLKNPRVQPSVSFDRLQVVSFTMRQEKVVPYRISATIHVLPYAILNGVRVYDPEVPPTGEVHVIEDLDHFIGSQEPATAMELAQGIGGFQMAIAKAIEIVTGVESEVVP